MNIRLMSFRLYQLAVTWRTYGNAFGLLSHQVTHLLLRPCLEKHENENHEGQTAEFAEVWVFVPVPSMEREWNVLYKHTGPVHNGTYKSKLETDLREGLPLWFRLVQFWCKVVNKSGNKERKDETKDADPRDAQSFDQFIVHPTCVKEKRLWKIGAVPRVPVTQLVRVWILCLVPKGTVATQLTKKVRSREFEPLQGQKSLLFAEAL